MHSCACGCGNKVVTPLSPVRWSLKYDGKTISLNPSIGNWKFDCESHYWVKENKIVWASKWSKKEIEEGKQNERMRREDYYQEVKNKEYQNDNLVSKTSNKPRTENKLIINLFIEKIKRIFRFN